MTTSSSSTSNSQSIYDTLNQSSSIASKSSSSSSTSTAATKDEFLTLLTTQLKNQDPLNPMDSAEMTSQLAQISTVDGITQLNATLSTMMSNLADTQASQAVSLVGQTVLANGSGLALSSSKGYGAFTLDGSADTVTATIKNSAGATVATLKLGDMKSGTHSFSWDGTTDAGGTAADGTYTFSISAKNNGSSVSNKTLSVGTVTSISRSGSTISANLGSLGAFALSDIVQVY